MLMAFYEIVFKAPPKTIVYMYNFTLFKVAK
jgi:hypothetical protein